MQSEAMSAFACREAKRKDAGEVFGRDANSVVRNGYLEPVISVEADGDAQLPIGAAGSIERILCVMDEIHQDLEHFVFVGVDRRHAGKVTPDLDAMALQTGGVQPQRIL